MNPKWIAWVAENALRGATTDQLRDTLLGAGMAPEEARATVQEIVDSPILQGARTVLRRSAGLEQAGRLRRSFEQLHTLDAKDLDTQRFFKNYWTAHRPVVLRGAAKAWPPWTLEGLKATHGHAEIEVLQGRTQQPRWWIHRESLRSTTTLSALIDRMHGPPSDDVYGVARNQVLETLPELLADLSPLPGIAEHALHPFLWIGPAGTFTPLHHDQSAAWLVQRIGRKRIWLASPLEPALMDTTDGVFNSLDARDTPEGDAREVHWWETVIEPDDAIFLPAGWWHQVLAETPSVSISLGNFRWPNARVWYAPGRYETARAETSGTLRAEGEP